MAGRKKVPPFVDPNDVRCPKCETSNPVEIVYGLPSTEMNAAALEGVIALGGCVVNDDSPAYECRACGHAFGEVDGI